MILMLLMTALAILALITQAGVVILQRVYPAQGRFVEVAGARLNILDLGPPDAAGPPVVMIHGASSNVLPNVGHMIQNAAPDLVIQEIESMIGKLAQNTAVAAN